MEDEEHCDQSDSAGTKADSNEAAQEGGILVEAPAQALPADEDENDPGGERCVTLLEISQPNGETIYLPQDGFDLSGNRYLVTNDDGSTFYFLLDGSEALNCTEESLIQSGISVQPSIYYLSSEDKPDELLTLQDTVEGNESRENENAPSSTAEADSVHLSKDTENSQTSETEQVSYCHVALPSSFHISPFAAEGSGNCKLSYLASVAQVLAKQQSNYVMVSNDDENNASTSATESVFITHQQIADNEPSLVLTHDAIRATDENEEERHSAQNQIEANDFDAVNAASCSTDEIRTNNAVSVISSALNIHKNKRTDRSTDNSSSPLSASVEHNENTCNEDESSILNSNDQLISDKNNLRITAPLIENVPLESDAGDDCLDLSYKGSIVLKVNDESQSIADNCVNESTFFVIDNECLGLKDTNTFHAEENSSGDVNVSESSSRDSYLEENKQESKKDFLSDARHPDNNNLSTCDPENASTDVDDIAVSNACDESTNSENEHLLPPMNLLQSESTMEAADIFNTAAPAENYDNVNRMLLDDEMNHLVSLKTHLPTSSKEIADNFNRSNLETSCESNNSYHSPSGEVCAMNSDSNLDKTAVLNNVQRNLVAEAEPPSSDIDEALPSTDIDDALSSTDVEDALPSTDVDDDALPSTDVDDALPSTDVDNDALPSTDVDEDALPSTDVDDDALPSTDVEDDALPSTDVDDDALPSTDVDDDALPSTDVDDALPSTDVDDALHSTDVDDALPSTDVDYALPSTDIHSPLPSTDIRSPSPSTDTDGASSSILTALSPSRNTSCSSSYDNSSTIKAANHGAESHLGKLSSEDIFVLSSQKAASLGSMNVTKVPFSSILTDNCENIAETSSEQADVQLIKSNTDAGINENLSSSQKCAQNVFEVNKSSDVSMLEDSSNAEKTSEDESSSYKTPEQVEKLNDSHEVTENHLKSSEAYVSVLERNECDDSEKTPIKKCAKGRMSSQDFSNSFEDVNRDAEISESSIELAPTSCKATDDSDENKQDALPVTAGGHFEHQNEVVNETAEQDGNDNSDDVRLEETLVRPPKKTYIKRRKIDPPVSPPKLNTDKERKIELFSCEELTDGIFNRNDEETSDVVKHSTSPKEDDKSDEEDDLSLLSGIKSKVSATYKRKRKEDNTRNLRSRSATSSKQTSKDDLSVASDDQDSDESLKLRFMETENPESLYWGAYLMNASFNSPENKKDSQISSKSSAGRKRVRFAPPVDHPSAEIENPKGWNKVVESPPTESPEEIQVERQQLGHKAKKQLRSIYKFKTISDQKTSKPNIVKYRAIMKKYGRSKLKKMLSHKHLEEPVDIPRTDSQVNGTNHTVGRLCIIDAPRRIPIYDDTPIDDTSIGCDFKCCYCDFETPEVENLIFHLKYCLDSRRRVRTSPVLSDVNNIELRHRIGGEQRNICENGSSAKRRRNGSVDSDNGDMDESSSTSKDACDSDQHDSDESLKENDFEEDDIVWVRLDDRFWPGLVFKLEDKRAWVLLINYYKNPKRYKMSTQRLHSYANSEYHKSILDESRNMAYHSQFKRAVNKAEDFSRKKCSGKVTSGKKFFGVNMRDDFEDLDESSISSMSEDEDAAEEMLLSHNGNRENDLPDNIPGLEQCTPRKSHFTEEEVEKLSQCILEGYCNDHLAAVYKGEADSDRHTYFFSEDEQLMRKLKCMSWFGPVSHTQIQVLHNYLLDEFKLAFGVEHHMIQYIYEVWIPEAIIKAISLVKDLPLEEASKFFEDEAYVLDDDGCSLENILTL